MGQGRAGWSRALLHCLSQPGSASPTKPPASWAKRACMHTATCLAGYTAAGQLLPAPVPRLASRHGCLQSEARLQLPAGRPHVTLHGFASSTGMRSAMQCHVCLSMRVQARWQLAGRARAHDCQWAGLTWEAAAKAVSEVPAQAPGSAVSCGGTRHQGGTPAGVAGGSGQTARQQ